MVSKRISKNIHLLKLVCSCKNNLRHQLIIKGSKEFIGAICECVDNLLNGRVIISKENFQKLRLYKLPFRKLIGKSSLKEKKKILVQKGGFLQFLIPAVITTIGSFISDAIHKS